MRKPVIAALNGHAIGIGLTLALQCDIRLAARDAKYGVVQVRRGVMPDAYSHWTLLHQHPMGRSDAIEGVRAHLEKRAPDWKLSVVEDWPAWPD